MGLLVWKVQLKDVHVTHSYTDQVIVEVLDWISSTLEQQVDE